MPTGSGSRAELREKWNSFFDLLWKAYPLHQDYGGAYNAFLDLLEEGTVDVERVLDKAESFARNVDPGKLEYVPHLKTWLRNRRFEDEDLFTDQTVASREWFGKVYRAGDVPAVVNKYGFIYEHPPIPPDVEDIRAWHLDQARAWIAQVANHVLHGDAPPE